MTTTKKIHRNAASIDLPARMVHSPSRRAVLVCLLLGFTFSAACGGGGGDGGFTQPAVEDPFSFDVAIGTQTAFQLLGVSGTVTVTGAPGAPLVSITGVRRVEAASVEDANAHLADLQVDVSSTANEVLVKTVQPQFAGGRNYIVNYTIALPDHLNISIMTVNGKVTVRSLNGNCTITSINGPIEVDAIVGNAILALTNGNITASVTLPATGQIDLRVANGDIRLAVPQTTSAQFSATVGIGSIALTNLVLSNEVITSTSHSGVLGSGNGTIALNAAIGSITVQGF